MRLPSKAVSRMHQHYSYWRLFTKAFAPWPHNLTWMAIPGRRFCTISHSCCFPNRSVLLKLEQEGSIASDWGVSENNRKARFYRLTRAGRKQLQTKTRSWEQMSAIIARFFAAKAEDLE